MQTIVFEVETEYGTYRDAIELPDDTTYTDQDLDAMKLQRVNNWIVAINAPEETPTE